MLENAGLVSSSPGEHNSVRYRIGSRVTEVVTPQKASSEGVTYVVTRDHYESGANPHLPSSSSSGVDSPPSPHPVADVCEDAMKPPKPTVCEVCYVSLPSAATRPRCDDHDDGETPPPPPPKRVGPPLRVVHSGATGNFLPSDWMNRTIETTSKPKEKRSS